MGQAEKAEMTEMVGRGDGMFCYAGEARAWDESGHVRDKPLSEAEFLGNSLDRVLCS